MSALPSTSTPTPSCHRCRKCCQLGRVSSLFPAVFTGSGWNRCNNISTVEVQRKLSEKDKTGSESREAEFQALHRSALLVACAVTEGKSALLHSPGSEMPEATLALLPGGLRAGSSHEGISICDNDSQSIHIHGNGAKRSSHLHQPEMFLGDRHLQNDEYV